MFQPLEVIHSFKALASADPQPDRSYCQMLELYARRFGFQSFHHLLRALKKVPSDRFGNISLKLMRRICEWRLPSANCPYFEFISFPDGKLGFYSYWIGWDRLGNEVRIPRPLNGPPSAEGLRKTANSPIYVVECDKELLAWRHNWRSTALIPDRLARSFFPLSFNKHFMVDKSASLRRRKNGGDPFSNNISFE